MQIKTIPLTQLKEADYNPRVDLKPKDAEYQNIKNSIDNFGYVEPIIWNERTGNIVGGHQRYKILKEQGATEVDVVVVDFDLDKEKACNLALNKAVGLWDDNKLEELLIELKDTEWNMPDYGFDELDLDISKEDDYIVGEYETESVVEKGDIWLLGNHRLMCGDSTNPDDVNRLMNGKLADLLLTDPPYGVDYQGPITSKRTTIENDNMDDFYFTDFLTKVFSNAFNSLKVGAAAYVFYADNRDFVFKDTFIHSGFEWRQNLNWIKDHFVLGMKDYQNRSEPILYGSKGKRSYFIEDRTQDNLLNFKNTNIDNLTDAEARELLNFIKEKYIETTDCIYCKRPLKSKIHPTMKPIELFGKLMHNSTHKGDLVLDLFGGSGTTIMAAQQLGRVAYSMEYDPHYCDCILERFEEDTGIKPVKENK